MIYPIAKRTLDLVVSIVLLILLSPLLVAIALMVISTSRGPSLYRGKRAGCGNRTFEILKFRTMVVDAENLGGPSTALEDPRITSIGRFLRANKLDELPQLVNVIKGEMSLVGPRPQVLYYTDKYEGEEEIILSVRPGITDLASLHFSDMDAVLGNEDVDKKYETEIEPLKNKLRIQYVKRASFLLDIRILFETFLGLFGMRKTTNFISKPQ